MPACRFFSNLSETNVVANAGPRELSPDENRTTELLYALWIAKSCRPFSIVADPGHKALVEYICAMGNLKTKHPLISTVVERVGMTADQLRVSLHDAIAQECWYYSLTTDLWSDRRLRSYVGLTITPEFIMRAFPLELKHCSQRHFAVEIVPQLAKTMGAWSLKMEFCTLFLRDGASNMIAAIDRLEAPRAS